MDEVKRGEAQHHGTLEIGQEHTHETYGREVIDAAHLRAVGRHLLERYAELVPGDTVLVAIAESLGCHTLVDDIVLADTHLAGIEGHTVLVILLILIQRIVLVDVLNVRSRLV